MGKTGAKMFRDMAPTSDAHASTDLGKSLFVQRMEARARKATPFKLVEFADHFGGEAPTAWARVATLAEQDNALEQAYAYIAKKANSSPLIEKDPAFVEACKTAEMLAEVFRESDAQDSLRLFPAADWIRENLTPYQIRLLLDRYNSVVQATQPGQGKVEPEWVADIAERCAIFEGTGVPDAVLEECSKPMLAEMFVRLAMMWQTERDQNAALRAAVEAYENHGGHDSEQTGSPQSQQSANG
jgi:hypothetical protein